MISTAISQLNGKDSWAGGKECWLGMVALSWVVLRKSLLEKLSFLNKMLDRVVVPLYDTNALLPRSWMRSTVGASSDSSVAITSVACVNWSRGLVVVHIHQSVFLLIATAMNPATISDTSILEASIIIALDLHSLYPYHCEDLTTSVQRVQVKN